MSIDLDALVQTMRLTAGHMAPVVLMPHEALALVAEVERLRGEVAELRALGVSLHKSAAMGRDAERAAVVAWLLEQIGLPGLSMDEKSTLVWASRRIERGEHRREEEK